VDGEPSPRRRIKDAHDQRNTKKPKQSYTEADCENPTGKARRYNVELIHGAQFGYLTFRFWRAEAGATQQRR
jgi:hypothetical protein